MLNLSTSQKPVFEAAHVFANAAKEATQAYMQCANSVTKAYFDAFTTCCKLTEETAQQASKTGSTAK
jgi:hypothetical protein